MGFRWIGSAMQTQQASSLPSFREGDDSSGPSLNRWGRLTDPSRETRFVEYALSDKIFLCRLFIFATVGAQFPFIFTDLRIFGFGLPFQLLLLARVAYVVLCFLFSAFLLRNRNIQRLWSTMTCWMICVFIYNALIATTRPDNFLGHLNVDVLAVLACYLFLPLPPWRLVVLGAFGTTLYLLVVFFLRPDVGQMEATAAVTAFALANLVGIIHAVRAGSSARREFVALTEVNEANLQLRRALSHIKTLEGLLPICSICKNVRDSDKKWIPVEEFLKTRSPARFSHDICPACMNSHYAEFNDSSDQA